MSAFEGIDTSTPLNLRKLAPLNIRISDIQHTDEFTSHEHSSESSVPSLPSELLDLVGNDWLNSSESNSNLNEIMNMTTPSDNSSKKIEEISAKIHIEIKKTTDSRDITKVCRILDNDSDLSNNDNGNSSILNLGLTDTNNQIQVNESENNNENLICSKSQNNSKDLLPKVSNDKSQAINEFKYLDPAGGGSKLKTVEKTKNISNIDSTDDSLEKMDFIDVHNLKIFQSNVRVNTLKKTEIRSKQYFCPYCKCMVTKFARHLQHSHSEILKVQKLMKLPLKNAKRLKLIREIRNQGTYLHNTRKSLNTGVLITSRRSQPGYNRNADHFTSCPRCKAFFSKLSIRMHEKKCGKIPKKDVLGTLKKRQGL